MISYAQNAEDVVLDRVLPQDKGFYVDVGAASPDAASVTRHFYEKGWLGINIEPRRDAWEELRQHRPRDLNLQIAVGDHDGVTPLYRVVEDPDLSTIDAADLSYLQARGYTYQAEEIQVKTLSSVLELAEVGTIDFLKVDAEGAERAVLDGLDLQRWRPAVIVIEAVHPWSTERADSAWRDILESNGYSEGLFDGINLFFVPDERSESRPLLVPASALDDYRTAELVAIQRELDWHRARLGLDRGGAEEAPAKVSIAPAPTRWAVVGSPGAGHEYIAAALARALDSANLLVAHPWEPDWDRLPRRCVISMAWGRSRELEFRFRQGGVQVVSPARHPYDLLMDAYLESHAVGESQRLSPDRFVDWARGDGARRLAAMTAEWWSTPATIRVRYEDLVVDPEAALTGVWSRLPPRARPALHPIEATADQSPLHLGAEHLRLLDDVYHELLEALGYVSFPPSDERPA